MYVSTQSRGLAGWGLAGYKRRGLGDLQDLSPDDPILQPSAADAAFTTYGATTGGSYPYRQVVPVSASQTFTGWLDANASMVGIAAVAFLASLLVAGRR